jgi:hypothetical protein
VPYFKRADHFNPSPSRIWRRRLAWAASFIVVLLVVTYVFRGIVISPLLARELESRLSLRLNRPVTVGRVLGNYFTGAVVTGFVVSRSDGKPLLTCERVDVRYDLIGILAGEGLAAVRSLNFSSVSVISGDGMLRLTPDRISLDTTGDLLRLANCELSGAHLTARIVDLAWDPRHPDRLPSFRNFDLHSDDIAAAMGASNAKKLPIQLLQPVSVSLRASGEAHGSIDIAEARCASGASEIAVSGTITAGSARAWRDATMQLHVSASLLDLNEVAAELPAGQIQAAAKINGPLSAPSGEGSIIGDEIVFRGTLIARAGVVARLKWPELDVIGATIEMEDGHFSAHGRADLITWQLSDANLECHEVPLELLLHFLSPVIPVTGTLSGSIAADGDSTLPKITISASIPDFAIAGQHGTLALLADQDAAGIHLRTLSLRGPITLDGQAFWPVGIGREGLMDCPDASGQIKLSGTVPDLGLITGIHRFAGSAEMIIEMHRESGGVALGEAALSLRDLQIFGGEESAASPPPPIDIVATMESSLTGLRAELTGSSGGSEVARGDISVPAGKFTVARLRTDPLTGALTLDNIALQHFQTVIPNLRRLNGNGSATLRISGTLFRPRWTGEGALEHVSCKFVGDIPALEDAFGRFNVDGTLLRIESLSGRMGYEPISAHGTVDLGATTTLDLRLNADNALLFSKEDLRARFSFADLSLSGPVDGLRLVGAITVTQFIWAKQMELITASALGIDDKTQFFAFRDNPLEHMTFDLAISGRESILLQSNLLRGKLSIDLNLRGTGAVPEPRGLIVGRDLRLKLPLTTLAVQQAEIRFPQADPFDPVLDAHASAHIQEQELRVHAHGPLNRKQDIRIEITSDPPLPEEDALLLLTTGKTGENLTGEDRTGYRLAGKYLGKELWHWISGPSDPEADESLFDRFSLDIGPESRTGAGTFTSEFRLNPTLNRIVNYFLVGERDSFDAFNLMAVVRARFR